MVPWLLLALYIRYGLYDWQPSETGNTVLMLAASSPSRNAFMIVECGAQPVELNMAQESAIKMTERIHFN